LKCLSTCKLNKKEFILGISTSFSLFSIKEFDLVWKNEFFLEKKNDSKDILLKIVSFSLKYLFNYKIMIYYKYNHT